MMSESRIAQDEKFQAAEEEITIWTEILCWLLILLCALKMICQLEE